MEQGALAQPGRHREFELLVEEHRAALARHARRLARDAEEAEDLLQETLVDAYRGFHGFQPGTRFFSWAARIMAHNHLDRLRRRRGAQVSLDELNGSADEGSWEPPDGSSDPERLLLHEVLEAPYDAALATLHAEQRQAVELCDLRDASYAEAAAAASCPVGTIRSRLHRAHRALRNFLGAMTEPVRQPARATSRRGFLLMGAGAALGGASAGASSGITRVLVWTPAGAEWTAPRRALREAFADPAAEGMQLLPEAAEGGTPRAEALVRADVLVLWAPPGGMEIPAAVTAMVARRVRTGRLGLLLLFGASDTALCGAVLGGETRWQGVRPADEVPVEIRVTAPQHPAARGVEAFRLATAQPWCGELAGPAPERQVLRARLPDGEAPAGLAWRAGAGRVYYFQPGSARAPVYEAEAVRRVLCAAARWCAASSSQPLS